VSDAEIVPDPDDPAVWAQLEPAQAGGLACVVCGHNYLAAGSRPRRAVGRAAAIGAVVYACEGDCADTAATLTTRGHPGRPTTSRHPG